jgi:hypothetical protein
MAIVARPPCGAIGASRSRRIIVSSTFGVAGFPSTVTFCRS